SAPAPNTDVNWIVGSARWLAKVRWPVALRSIALFFVPVAAIVLVGMWMNQARWENPFDFGGHRYLMIRGRSRIERWGLFSYHYLAKNLAVFLASLPWLTVRAPHFIISRHGLALWVTTPNLLWVLWPKRVDTAALHLMIAAGAVAIWDLLYQNS